MDQNSSPALSGTDLNMIRDAVPGLDLCAIRSLRRAGFEIVKNDDEHEATRGKPVGQKLTWDDPNHQVSSAA